MALGLFKLFTHGVYIQEGPPAGRFTKERLLGQPPVTQVTPQGATFDFVTGLSGPRGLCWDGDQTIFVADEAGWP